MTLSGQSVAELLAALGEKTPAPASGVATAVAAALSAALVELAGRFAGDGDAVERAVALRGRLLELGDEDAEAYTAFMAERTPETRARIVAVPEELAALADETAELAARVQAQLKSSVAGDAEVAGELARAAATAARRLAAMNA